MVSSRFERMERVRADAFSCRRCDLWHARTVVVFGEGSLDTPLMLVGEAPGETEDHTGHPFVGRAGQILTRALNENMINRKHVWITNVARCRPTDFSDHRLKNRAPTISEIKACMHWLEQQIEIIKPPVILCLGVHSANTIIHANFRITRERGIWFTDSPYAPNVMAAFHPAYILRQVGRDYDAAYQSLVRDIAQAKERAISVRKMSVK